MHSPCSSASLSKALVSFSKPQRQSFRKAPSYLAIRSGTVRSNYPVLCGTVGKRVVLFLIGLHLLEEDLSLAITYVIPSSSQLFEPHHRISLNDPYVLDHLRPAYASRSTCRLLRILHTVSHRLHLRILYHKGASKNVGDYAAGGRSYPLQRYYLSISTLFPPQCVPYAATSLALFVIYALMKCVTYYPQVVLGVAFAWALFFSVAALGDPDTPRHIMTRGSTLALFGANVL